MLVLFSLEGIELVCLLLMFTFTLKMKAWFVSHLWAKLKRFSVVIKLLTGVEKEQLCTTGRDYNVHDIQSPVVLGYSLVKEQHMGMSKISQFLETGTWVLWWKRFALLAVKQAVGALVEDPWLGSLSPEGRDDCHHSIKPICFPLTCIMTLVEFFIFIW